MAEKIPNENHIRHCMLYEFGHDKTASEAARSINKIYPDTLSVRKCQRWFSRFKNGNFDLEDAFRSGKPATVDTEVIKASIEDNPCQTLIGMSSQLGINRETIRRSLKKMGKESKAGIWAPHELTDDQKKKRFSICKMLILKQKDEDFLNRIITGDEKWVMYDNSSRKRQWLSPRQRHIVTTKPNIHGKKVMLSVWWSARGVIHYELLQPGETITADVYCAQLERLKDKLEKKWPALTNRNRVILHHDNARPHIAKKTLQKIKDFGWELLSHPPYSPDIAPSDYHLFRAMQHFLVGKKYASHEAINIAIQDFFDSKPVDFYKDGLMKLVCKWSDIVENNGAYVFI